MARSLKKGYFIDDHLRRQGGRDEFKRRPEGRQDLVAPFDDRSRTWSGTPSPCTTARQFIPVYVTENMVGHKLGEFAATRTFRGHSGKKAAEKTVAPKKS